MRGCNNREIEKENEYVCIMEIELVAKRERLKKNENFLIGIHKVTMLELI